MPDPGLRVGVIGAGWVASARHIPCFQRLRHVEVVAVLDHHSERARHAADAHKVALATDDADRFYAADLDVVAICTPPQTHAPLTVDALQRGCHVFVEKPMAMFESQARAMIAAAEENHRVLCVSHNLLFSRSMQRIKRMLADGDLGEVRQVTGFQLSSPTRRLPIWYSELPGGLFFDEAAHLIYLMRDFMGDVQLDTATVNYGLQTTESVESVYATFHGSSGIGSLSMFFEAPVSEWLLCVVGSRKVVVFDLFRDILATLRPDGGHTGKEVLTNSLLTGSEFTRGFVTSGFLHATGSLFYGHEKLIERFVESIRHNVEAPVTGADGLAVVRTIQQLLGSHRSVSKGIAQ